MMLMGGDGMNAPFVGVSPLQRPKSLNNLAYESLKNSILAGRLVPGVIYSELELARRLGISRTPVREALLRLAAENFIVFHSKKGMSINFFSKEDIENLFELREAIEERAVSKIAATLTKDQIGRMKEILAEQEECTKNRYDEMLFLEVDKKFHVFLIEASGNRFMVQTYNNIRDYITIPAKKALMKKGRVNEVIQEHRAIVKALSERNVAKVRETVKKHLINSKLMALEGRDKKKASHV
ncbi:MAG: GntR family transcriptional regulator [Deltaproteobacteria bacterium]|nr:MAG: GntR family transcriptional regulator [Deltaproteobacteria bacterium]